MTSWHTTAIAAMTGLLLLAVPRPARAGEDDLREEVEPGSVELTVNGGAYGNIAGLAAPELSLTTVMDETWVLELGVGLAPPANSPFVEASVQGGLNLRLIGKGARHAGTNLDLRVLTGLNYLQIPFMNSHLDLVGISAGSEIAGTRWLNPSVGVTLALQAEAAQYNLGSPILAGRASVGLTF
ncbi:MAG TPA: hypothetical protein VND93_11220 [Myxococcales bacterium]|jgi:hypothetical protein|nr:hypothetical protein [Myxococcales bacterium]